jgi:hypothetical protein
MQENAASDVSPPITDKWYEQSTRPLGRGLPLLSVYASALNLREQGARRQSIETDMEKSRVAVIGAGENVLAPSFRLPPSESRLPAFTAVGSHTTGGNAGAA